MIAADTSSFSRYFYSIVLSVIVTLALIYLMQALIRSDDSGLSDAPSGRLIDFVRLTEDIDVNIRERKPPKPEEPPPEPPPPELVTNIEALGVDISDVNFNSGVNIRIGGFANDGEYLPIVKVAPVYPRRALTRGIEGYVILSFTVTATGAVRDPLVIEADPKGVFDRSAIQAALKFKYKPKVVDGEPVEVAGVQNLIRFELEDAR